MPKDIRKKHETPKELKMRHHDYATSVVVFTVGVFFAWIVIMAGYVVDFITS